jgi:hypothetical protein
MHRGVKFGEVQVPKIIHPGQLIIDIDIPGHIHHIREKIKQLLRVLSLTVTAVEGIPVAKIRWNFVFH